MWRHGSKGSCLCENLQAQTLESGVGSLNNIAVPYFYCLKWSIYSADWVKTPIIIELCSFVNKSRWSLYIHDSSVKGQINIKIEDDGL